MVELAPRARGRYDAAVARSLPGLTAGLSVTCLVLAGLLAAAGGPARWVGAAAAAVVAVLAGALSLVAAHRGLPQRQGHPLGAAALVLAAVVVQLPVALEQDVRYGSATLLVVAAAGAALLDPRWLAGTLGAVAAVVAGTTAVAAAGAGDAVAVAGPFVAACALASALHVVRRRGVDALVDVRAAVREETVRDHLTGAVNHRGVTLLGRQMVEAARRQGDAVHVVFVGVHRLEAVRSALGQEAADEVLISVADAMRSSVRATDVVARWHGDDFCVVGPGPGMPPVELERRVRDYLKRRPPVDRRVWDPRVDTGGAMLTPWDSGSVEELLERGERELEVQRALAAPVPPPVPPHPGARGSGLPHDAVPPPGVDRRD
ncbi:diguanylate cyclase domain-containing protein [Vallicoccus soli]|uniref:Diguanylate cyclase n=1 Tax=Vallicoccus soli TaxID=2339232 RepID=A0A3A3Z5T0_9ACTN|nr:diguanylate cyclase [Vallicoccus soli]RJK97068.1 diguanylate cyclase [Vallicoccus soli]